MTFQIDFVFDWLGILGTADLLGIYSLSLTHTLEFTQNRVKTETL